ncbi:MAG: carboxypeptidase regulatory-like domain-containing protein [Deltaproteobacteria bacterium]|nr:carboxypeptidase regulatory-like domain-containing protein [Deltaproteobacteria bacterium]
MRWLAVLMLVVAVGAGVVRAAPQVEIKAHTRLTLERVRLTSDRQVEVIGQLTDKLTSDGLANQYVRVRIGDEEVRARTDADGKFRARLTAGSAPQEVHLAFPGAGNLDGAAPVSLVTDPSKAPVVLTVRAEMVPDGARISVSATVDDNPTPLTVVLSVGAPGDEEMKAIKPVDTGTTFVLTRAMAGGPGPKRVRASFAGDGDKQAAHGEVTIELSSATRTTMDVADTSLAYEDNVLVRGTVVDDDGSPVRRAAVTLMANDNTTTRRLAQGATTEDGTYAFKVEAEIVGQGTWGIFVQSDPGVSYMRPSHSDPAHVKIAAPQPVPVSYTIAAFVATALAAGGFFTARAKPWRRLRRPAPPADAPEHEGDGAEADGGLVVAKPGLVSTLRRPHDEGFSGVVRDTVRGRPVEGAVVRLTLDADTHELATSADGSFAIERLAVGEWRAEVGAPGHLTEKFAVSIPHRGELRGVRVDLVPVRERVFQLYRRAAEPALPEPRLWGVWSPRQIIDHVKAKRPSPALADLTDFVEEIYFSPRLAPETVLGDASERVDRAIRERARV